MDSSDQVSVLGRRRPDWRHDGPGATSDEKAVPHEKRTRIGQAVGIVMERYAAAEQRVFAFWTQGVQTRNVKLRRIADGLIVASDAAAAGA